MKYFSLIVLLAALLLPAYNYAFAFPAPPCPCDTAELGNQVTGNDIIEEVCPGGNLGPDSEATIIPGQIRVSLEVPPFSVFSVTNIGNESFTCFITQEGEGSALSILDPEQFEACRERLLVGCNLKLIRPIPTLSQWGLIALAGILGLIGLVAIRRKRQTT